MTEPTIASWDDVLAAAERLGRNAFVASVDGLGRPHLSVVWLVVVDGVFHLVCDRTSAKARNLGARPALSVHWQISEEGSHAGEQLLVRGTATLVEKLADRNRLWHSGSWGDMTKWWSGPADQAMAFIRIDASSASITESFGSGPARRWTISSG